MRACRVPRERRSILELRAFRVRVAPKIMRMLLLASCSVALKDAEHWAPSGVRHIRRDDPLVIIGLLWDVRASVGMLVSGQALLC